MKSHRDIRDYLQDIQEAINDIENFTQNLTYEQFTKDRKTLNAVVRSLEIIGEASKQLPDTLKAEYSELPWKEITGMRDKLIHAYFGMDTETIWQTVKQNIPPLKQTIKKMIKDQEKK
jgi:uncharacterized protein with HEPN domain